MRFFAIIMLALCGVIHAQGDETKTVIRRVINKTDFPYAVYRRCDVVTKGEAATQVYYAGEAGFWQHVMTVVPHSVGLLGDPSGDKGITIRDPYLLGCQIKLAPICSEEKGAHTFYVRQGTKVSGKCPSIRSAGPYLIETSTDKDFEDIKDKCQNPAKVVRYCCDEIGYAGVIITKDELQFMQEENLTLIGRKREKPPFIIEHLRQPVRELKEEVGFRERATRRKAEEIRVQQAEAGLTITQTIKDKKIQTKPAQSPVKAGAGA